MMTRSKRFPKLPLLIGLALFIAAPLHAACYADYRAKKDNPLRLHYGVIDLRSADCTMSVAASVIPGRIASDGWDLLQVISVFDDSGLATRRADAGAYFLRF
jgi:hypothetical protein